MLACQPLAFSAPGVDESDGHVHTDGNASREPVEHLTERGAGERVLEPTLVQHDHDPAPSAAVHSGDRRHSRGYFCGRTMMSSVNRALSTGAPESTCFHAVSVT